jgi:hypothetical protein
VVVYRRPRKASDLPTVVEATGALSDSVRKHRRAETWVAIRRANSGTGTVGLMKYALMNKLLVRSPIISWIILA